jgi:hypothetical protein
LLNQLAHHVPVDVKIGDLQIPNLIRSAQEERSSIANALIKRRCGTAGSKPFGVKADA